jgi:putative spermidine/putrescine transport system permease protein
METTLVRNLVRVSAALVLVFLYVPIVIVVLYAFNDSPGQAWPIQEYTTKWFSAAWHSEQVRTALPNSLVVATVATLFALALGSLAAFAVHRFRFFGRNSVSFLLVLPIALPGIVTAIALNTTINNFQIPFGLQTIFIGHATFCIVVVYNNVIARFRRTAPNLIEASMDLGADGFQTFRHVLLPNIATALLAGGMLAFALSFDEVIVTTFTAGQQTTLPIWMLSELVRPRQRPVTNVVAVFVIAVTLVPILVAYRVTRGTETVAGGGR